MLPLLRGAKRDDLLLVSLGLLIYFMSATLVWLHYLVLCFIPAYALFRNRITAAIGFIALLLMADVPYAMVHARMPPEERAKFIFVALVLLYVPCVVLLWRGRKPRVPAFLNSAGPAGISRVPKMLPMRLRR